MTGASAAAARTCCTASAAWAWVELLADVALRADADATRLLGLAVEHWLAARRD